MKKKFYIFSLISLIISLGLIPLSWFYFISFGIDIQQEREGQAYQHYLHIQMIGNGTIGLDLSYIPIDKMSSPLDLGGTWTTNVKRPEPRNLMNFFGFWILQAWRVYQPNTRGYWIAVPIYSILLINIILLLYFRSKIK